MDDSRLFIEVLASLPPLGKNTTEGAYPAEMAVQFLGSDAMDSRKRVLRALNGVRKQFGLIVLRNGKKRTEWGGRLTMSYCLPAVAMNGVSKWLKKQGFTM